MVETPSYIKTLLIPNGRKVWSINLEQTWLPFFLASNTAGETHISSESLGAPLRLAYNSDGSVKFSKAGRPIFRVVKDLSDAVKMVRENFAASLASYAKQVYQANPEGYKAEIQKAQEAGQPIMARDRQALEDALAKMVEAEKAEAPKPKAKRKRAKATPKAPPPEPTPELVAV